MPSLWRARTMTLGPSGSCRTLGIDLTSTRVSSLEVQHPQRHHRHHDKAGAHRLRGGSYARLEIKSLIGLTSITTQRQPRATACATFFSFTSSDTPLPQSRHRSKPGGLSTTTKTFATELVEPLTFDTTHITNSYPHRSHDGSITSKPSRALPTSTSVAMAQS